MKNMLVTNPFEALAERQIQKRQQVHHLIELAQQWDKPIRAGLRQLAQIIWPDSYTFGLIPIRRYRLRQRSSARSYVWWIEHDIPPYDRYWCAAYRVKLNLDTASTPQLQVQSGTTIREVWPLTTENLSKILAQAGADLPLLIPRHMGRADDP